VAAGRRRTLARELAGRVAFERRAYLLVPREGQRTAYDEYIVSHRVRAKELAPELDFAIPRVGQAYPKSSLPAQLLAAAVAERHPDRLETLEDALFRAMFVELRDISAADVLRDTARAAGVPEQLVEQALADPELRDRVFAEHSEGVEAGVTGIPALVIPGYAAVTGAVPLDALRRAFEQVLAAPAPSQSA
jgi:predicted DsbA family dithiol-disulfide isomerase